MEYFVPTDLAAWLYGWIAKSPRPPGPLPAPRQMTPLRRRAPEAARSFRFGRALPADAAIYPEKLEGPVLQLKMRL